MTTQTRTRNCALCGKSGAEQTTDRINYFCFDPTECLDRALTGLEQTNYQDASPELYNLFKLRQAMAKTDWTKWILATENLRTVLGLDDTTFLTYTKLMAEMSAEDDQC